MKGLFYRLALTPAAISNSARLGLLSSSSPWAVSSPGAEELDPALRTSVTDLRVDTPALLSFGLFRKNCTTHPMEEKKERKEGQGLLANWFLELFLSPRG